MGDIHQIEVKATVEREYRIPGADEVFRIKLEGTLKGEYGGVRHSAVMAEELRTTLENQAELHKMTVLTDIAIIRKRQEYRASIAQIEAQEASLRGSMQGTLISNEDEAKATAIAHTLKSLRASLDQYPRPQILPEVTGLEDL